MRLTLNWGKFLKEFKVDAKKKTKLTHSAGSALAPLRILPFVTNRRDNYIQNYKAWLGSFSRALTEKQAKELNKEAFFASIKEKIFHPEHANSLFYIIEDLFFENDELIFSHPAFFNYLPKGTSHEEKVASFLVGVFGTERVKNAIKQAYAKKPNNVLLLLLYDSLPELNPSEDTTENYHCLLPEIQRLFEEDFLYLVQHEEVMVKYFEHFVSYYYFFYTTQLILYLNKMFISRRSLEPVYFFVDWEKRSKSRQGYIQGWNMIATKLPDLLPHAVCLNMLNCLDGHQEKAITYQNLIMLIKKRPAVERNELLNELNYLIHLYKSFVDDVDWRKFQYHQQIAKDIPTAVYLLQKAIAFQYDHSGRKKKKLEFYEAYTQLAKHYSFVKRSGNLGYTTNLTQDYIIFLTKLCMKEKQEISIQELFRAFQRRGIYFDYATEKAIRELYQKLNLLEKKSDSGDAQYVKRIL